MIRLLEAAFIASRKLSRTLLSKFSGPSPPPRCSFWVHFVKAVDGSLHRLTFECCEANMFP